ncbi:MAG: phosphoglucosamine mutase [Gallicola sp.]|nr:phosphoglucosamine mutase [Gallicola sp.]
MGKYFGTDGVRGIANDDLSPELAFKLGRAVAEKLDDEAKLMVIGKDTRLSGDMLESALIAGLNSAGFSVIRLGVIPTPAVAFLTRYYKASAGAVISASHNPGEFNGIKFFGSTGFKLPDALEDEIEELIENPDTEFYPTHEKVGRVYDRPEGTRIYIDFLKTTIQESFEGIKIALDCGHGATYKIAPVLFQELGAEVQVINTEPDGMNINLNCGSTNPDIIKNVVIESKADMGFSFDGDGDRLIAVDETGEIMDGDHLIAACTLHLKEQGKLKNNGVVGTVMTNIGFDECMKKHDVDVFKANVGDRYVLEMMVEEGFIIGGEQSGHIIFLEDNTTGDGMLSALKVAEMKIHQKKKMSELNQLMTTYPQVLVNARVKKKNQMKYVDDAEIQKEIKKLEEKMKGQGRVLIRPSGTEPLVRVMLEGQDQEQMNRDAVVLAELISNKYNH